MLVKRVTEPVVTPQTYEESLACRKAFQMELCGLYFARCNSLKRHYSFNPYSADFFYFFRFDISCCLGISRKGSI